MQYAFSLPTKANKVPVGPDWIHEVKYDGYRMMLICEKDRVRLISRGGHDWATHFPLIVEAALKLRQKHFVIDGETVVLDRDGVSNFDALHLGKHNRRAQLYAFDVLAGDGEDHRPLPISLRKRNLARLLRGRVPGIFPPSMTQVRSPTIYSVPPATWASKASSRSAAIVPVVPANSNIGSR
jgi:bifunctional non-homologous end joining protein LigD